MIVNKRAKKKFAVIVLVMMESFCVFEMKKLRMNSLVWYVLVHIIIIVGQLVSWLIVWIIFIYFLQEFIYCYLFVEWIHFCIYAIKAISAHTYRY